jgi:acyl-CoA synthetase (NDP forming)
MPDAGHRPSTTAHPLLQPLLSPRSVAVIGASPKTGGHSGRAVANLQRTGYRGRIYPVNPRYTEIAGLPCVPSVLDIEADVDAAYVLVPAARVPEAVAECAERRVRTVIVCTAGFGELGEQGRAQQDRMVEVARAAGTRILGPNCIGVLNLTDRYVGAPTFNITYAHTPGPLTILSHSGGMASILFNRAQERGIGVRAVVNFGNEADIELAEVLEALVDDDETRVIGLFVEQLRDGPRFIAAAERARDAGKPIVALKAGRSAAGARTVFGHTGALAGEHEVFSSVARQLGVLEVRGVDELLDNAHLLGATRRPAGPRLGVLSPSGGESGYVADLASDAGLELPALAPASELALGELLRFGNPGNPLDPTGAVIGNPGLFRDVLAIFSRDPNFDMLHIALPAWGEMDAETLLPLVLQAARDAGKPAVVSAWRARGLTERADELLRDSSVPSFESSDRAVGALAALAYWAAATARAPDTSPPPVTLERPVDGVGNEYEAKQVLAAGGVAVSGEVLVADPQAVAGAAAGLAGPLVLKLLARGIVHKSDLGLVKLGLGHDDVGRAAHDLASRARDLDLDVEGFLLAEQIDGVEMIVGGMVDPTFGPLVMVGAGGVLAELLSDSEFLLCPASPAQVEDALRRLRIWRVLDGYRGQRFDTAALIGLTSRFSQLFAGSPWMAEVDLNPVMVRPTDTGGAVVVDAAIRTAGTA